MMKGFILKTILFLFILFSVVELFSRLVIDPFYFYALNTFDVRSDRPGWKEVHDFKRTEHVDYLFIGSSRVPATINAPLIMKNEPDKIAIVAGRGYMTEGIHIQALENRLMKYPGYLKGANVFLEYPGPDIFSGSYRKNKFKVYEPVVKNDKAMPQLLLPYLNFSDLMMFLKESANSVSVKVEMVLMYLFSSYRTIPFIRERFARIDDLIHSKRSNRQLVSEGGIRNDNFDEARKKALVVSEIQRKEIQERPLLSFEELDSSSLAYLNDLIVKYGGRLFLYSMPLSTVQESVYSSMKATKDRIIFEEWIGSKGIAVIKNDKFNFQDSDFPDTWHLNENRRDEFTLKIMEEIRTITKK